MNIGAVPVYTQSITNSNNKSRYIKDNIEMNCNMNSTSPSFKGIYVINGKGSDVQEYDKMMRDLMDTYYELNPNESFGEPNPKKKTDELPYNYNCLYITGLYGDDQQNTKLLVTTNEDTQVLANWYNKYDTIIEKFDSGEMPFSEEGEEAFWEAVIDFCEPKVNEFSEAKAGGIDTELDFILERDKEAQIKLEQMKEFTTKPINIYNYDDIKEGLDSGNFNPVTGVFNADA